MSTTAATAKVPTVYVVDDDESIREMLVWLMNRHELKVEAFADARGFLSVYRPELPGCLLLDLNLPDMDGLDLQSYLNENGVLLPVIFMSGRANVPKAVRAVKGGAIDFIEKPFDYKHIVAVVQECLVRDAAARAAQARDQSHNRRLAQLSQREREVMNLVVAGKLNREIADELSISIKTVEVHRAHVMEKLEVKSLAQLVQLAVGAGGGGAGSAGNANSGETEPGMVQRTTDR